MIRVISIAALGILSAQSSMASGGEPVSFSRDVMAVLSKSGCNQGTCHGNKNGKGGFKLSLRGQDPERDFQTLSRELLSRRVNLLEPEASLLLLKPTMQVPHEGGRRFRANSIEFAIVERWIRDGMPGDFEDAPKLERLEVTPTTLVLVEPGTDFQLQVTAKFSNGETRDVTRLAVFEPVQRLAEVSVDGKVTRFQFGEETILVRYLDQQQAVTVAFVPKRSEFVWDDPAPANFIDEHVFAKLRSLRINPSPICTDEVFLRRAYLDLVGMIPTAEEASRFMADSSPDKRDRLVNSLLERSEFADVWALKWSDLLRNEEKTLDRKGVRNFHEWIRGGIAANKPLDQFVFELISARGSSYQHPPANYYRAMRDPFTRGEVTAQVFLGIRLGCAKCHNHPFDQWTQDDYYGWANLFARVDYKIMENRRRDRNDKHEFDGEQIVFMKSSGDVKHPETGQVASPRFLADVKSPVDFDQDRLFQLAEWLTDENDRFAQTQVNRIWFHLMGRGIVDPIDDFRDTNPPVNTALLDALAADFVSHGYDLRRTIRLIMKSKTYQLSSAPNESNRDDVANFSHSSPRRLTAEQLLDSLSQFTAAPVEFNGYPIELRAHQLPGVRAVRLRDESPSGGDQFLKLFGKPPRLQSCECERSPDSTLAQTFQMVSGRLIDDLLSRDANRLAELSEAKLSAEELIAELYWAALTRPPTSEELAAMADHVESADDRRRALEDVAWALANSDEFLLRR